MFTNFASVAKGLQNLSAVSTLHIMKLIENVVVVFSFDKLLRPITFIKIKLWILWE